MKSKRRLTPMLIATVLLAWTQDARAIDVKPEVEVGYQGAAFVSGHATRNRLYALAGLQADFGQNADTGSSFRLDATGRAYVDYEVEASLRALALTRIAEHWRLKIGVQEIAWGETFGLPIADLVSPRDLRDPLFLDLDWIRLPVAAANLQLTFGDLRLQLVATPFPRNNQYPARQSYFDLFPPAVDALPIVEGQTFPLDRYGQDTEAGVRASYLVGGGVDLTALYFFHWNRNPVFEIVPRGTELALRPVVDRTHTAGISFTKTAGDFVFRGDSLVHLEQPIQDAAFRTAPRGIEVESILGADVTTESEWTLGLQYHFDLQNTSSETRHLHWASARVMKSFLDGDLVPEVFAFRGINNSDMWIQPKLTFHFFQHLSLSLRGDFIWGKADESRGLFGFFREQQRGMVWAKATF